MDKNITDFTSNIWNKSVEIESHIWNGYKFYTEYMEISLDEYQLEKYNKWEFSYRSKRSKNDSLANWVGKQRAVDYLGKNIVNIAENMVKNMKLTRIPMLLEKGKNTHSWELISNEAKDLGMPKHFKNDLNYHDALQLGIYNHNKFLWIIRDTGTWLFHSWNGINNKFARAAINQDSKDKTAKIYLFQNNELKQVNFKDFINE